MDNAHHTETPRAGFTTAKQIAYELAYAAPMFGFDAIRSSNEQCPATAAQ